MSRLNTKPINIGITMGDPAGVGPQIIAKAIAGAKIYKWGRILVIGDRWVFEKCRIKRCEPKNKNYEFIDLNNAPRKNFKFGKLSPGCGQAAVEYLKKAIELIKLKRIDCLVTAPISKQAINSAGHNYSGHTELLAEAFGKKENELMMMLLNKYIKISLATRHLPLSKVASKLKQRLICRSIIITGQALSAYFAIRHPKICVASLNPHAGEGGMLGNEETRLIIPAINRARKTISNITGPLPADTAMSCARRGRFDAVVAMYHDQALIPLKLLDFDSGVNLTFGLNFVRTSPLHGTGFDIAAKNIANPNSLIAAIKTAIECTKNLYKIKKAD